jgi:hypothetical protein
LCESTYLLGAAAEREHFEQFRLKEGWAALAFSDEELQLARKDPRSWWQRNGNMMVQLKIVANTLLSMTCSSGACERVWSAYTAAIGENRQCIDVNKQKQIVQVRAWLRYEEQEKTAAAVAMGNAAVMQVVAEEEAAAAADGLDEHVVIPPVVPFPDAVEVE